MGSALLISISKPIQMMMNEKYEAKLYEGMTERGDVEKVNAVANKAEETRSKPVQGEVDWKLEGKCEAS